MAADMFLKLDGVTGESQDAHRGGEIEIQSFSWGASNASSGASTTGSGAAKGTLQDITVTKSVDKTTPLLYSYVWSGFHVPSGQITVRKAGGAEPVEYLTLSMEGLYLTSYSVGGADGGEILHETFSLTFNRIKVEYKTQAGSGTTGEGNSQGWDLTTQATWS
jgi:type VI secretion system secreted protein Hcp